MSSDLLLELYLLPGVLFSLWLFIADPHRNIADRWWSPGAITVVAFFWPICASYVLGFMHGLRRAR